MIRRNRHILDTFGKRALAIMLSAVIVVALVGAWPQAAISEMLSSSQDSELQSEQLADSSAEEFVDDQVPTDSEATQGNEPNSEEPVPSESDSEQSQTDESQEDSEKGDDSAEQRDDAADEDEAAKDDELDDQPSITAVVATAQARISVAATPTVGSVIKVTSDEGVELAFNITSSSTVSFGTGSRPSSESTTIDYSYSGAITVPSTVEYQGKSYTVTAVSDYALALYYKNSSRITSKIAKITLPDTVTSIGSEAFEYCTKLASIYIPATVSKIGSHAFAYANASNVVFEDGSSLKSIPDYCFLSSSVSSLDFLPSSVTSIGTYAFSDTLIKSAIIPSQVTSLGNAVFAHCRLLTHAEFEGEVPNNEIPTNTFKQCSSLRSFTITSDIYSLGSGAFAESGLSSIFIPTTLTYIDEDAFEDCGSLTSVEFEAGHEMMQINAGVFSGCTSLKQIQLPSTIRSIGASAFAGCTSLQSIDLPATIESLGSFSFKECTSLETVTFLGDASDVSSEASTFYLANSLKSVVFMDKKATTLTYPSAIPTVYYTISYYLSEDAIGAAEPYAQFIVAANSVPSSAQSESVYSGEYLASTPSGATWLCEAGFSPSKEITDSFYEYAPGSSEVLEVGDTFVANTIEDVAVTYTVVSLGEDDEHGVAKVGYSTSLGHECAIDESTTGSITIPDSVIASDGKTYDVTSIEPEAFLNCKRISAVTIPASIASIGKNAFARCSTLREIHFDSDASQIVDDGIFAGCSEIQKVFFGGKKANLSFGTSSPDIYYTVFCYESKADMEIDNVQATVIVHERAVINDLKDGDIYSGELPELKPGYDWKFEDGFGADIPITDSCKIYALGMGFQYEIDVLDGNVSRTDCWFKVLSFDEESKTGTVMVGLGKEGISAIHTSVSGTPVIPETVTDEDGNSYKVIEVGDYAFGSQVEYFACHYIDSVSLPSSITQIGKYAFAHCEELERIEIPENVEALGASVFSDCYKLWSVKFAGSKIASIPERAFYGDYGLSTISLPEGITSIEPYAFANCYKYIYSPRQEFGLTSIDFPSTLVSIGDYAFYNDGEIASLNMPVSLAQIGDYAFYGCNDVTFIRFAGNASKLSYGTGAFYLVRAAFESALEHLIYMDKKSPTLEGAITLQTSLGNSKSFDTYYTVRFYRSQSDFDAGNIASSLVIHDNTAAIHYTDNYLSGSMPNLSEGMTWSCESGFDTKTRTKDSYYAIAGYDLSKATVSFDSSTFYYTGGYIKPKPTVTWLDGRVLEQGVDYVLDSSKGTNGDGYTNNRHGPVATVYIKGVGEYAGIAKGTFNISTQVDSAGTFSVAFDDNIYYVYDGTEKTPAVSVTATFAGSSRAAIEGEDYMLSYTDNVNAGTAHVVVTGLGIYGGQYVADFTIHPMSILKCKVSGIETSYSLLDGYAKPKVSLANPDGVSLVEGTDFAVAYSNNSSSGIGTIRIKGIGNYTGAIAKTFSVYGGGNPNGSDGESGDGASSSPGGSSTSASGTAGANGAQQVSIVGNATGADATGAAYNIYTIGASSADLTVQVTKTPWWILVLLLDIAIAVGAYVQKKGFDKQLGK